MAKSTSRMTIDERYAYLQIQYERYCRATKPEKNCLLDEMMAVTGLTRNHLIELLQHPPKRQARQQQRHNSYAAATDAALQVIWEAQNYIGAERLQAVLWPTAQALERAGELTLTPQVRSDLQQLSVSTLYRHLRQQATPANRRRAAAARLNTLQRAVPARPIPWNTTEPGHLELDTVLHCGATTAGEYVLTVTLVDVATGWTQCRAILGRSALVIAAALLALLHALLFTVCEIHPDNGSEFFNDLVLHTLHECAPDVVLSRSRPAHPNDNRFVEQRNGGFVRAWLGDRRLDTVAQTRYLNALYSDWLCPYFNLIQPCMRQIDKQVLPPTPTHPLRVRRRHDTPTPPVLRLCATPELPEARRTALLKQRDCLNPLQLKRQIEAAIAHLFAYPAAVPGQPENVFETLAHPEHFPAACTALGIPYLENTTDPQRDAESSLKDDSLTPA